MATLFGAVKAPRCLSCLRNSTKADFPASTNLFQVQIRGKKKKAKLPPTVPVRLLKNTPSYGPKGSIVPVTPGRMRNIWYPRGRAEYMTISELRDVKDLPKQRNYTFGARTKELQESDAKQAQAVNVKLDLLPSERAQELLQNLIPKHIDFYRTTIPQNESQEETKNKNLSETPLQRPVAGDSTSTNVGSIRNARPDPIFGSVSTGDILTNLKALLAQAATDESDVARIVLSLDDISIVRTGAVDAEVETDRVKVLGEFEFIIQLKGAKPVRRRVNVKPQA